MAGRQTRGRQRIPIRRIENQDDLYATFSKRRHGVYRKASELSTLCGADVGVIMFSPSNNPFSFFSPTMDSVVNRYMNPNQQLNAFERVVEDHTRIRIRDFNRRLDEVQERKEELKQRENYLDEIDMTRQKGWWEQVPVESLNREQLQQWKAWFQNLRSQVTNRIEELKNEGSSSSVFQEPNPSNFLHTHAAATLGGASIFPQNYIPPSASYAPTGETIVSGQFPTQYYVPTMAQYPSSASGSFGGMSHIPFQYHVPPQPQGPSIVGGSFGGTSQVPFHYHVPPQTQDPSNVGGGFGRTSHVPPQAQDPFVAGSSIDPFPTQDDYYFPPQDQNPSAGGRTGGAGPSNINP